MKKRIISAVLMSIMAIGLMTGCANNEEVATDAVVDTIYIGHQNARLYVSIVSAFSIL